MNKYILVFFVTMLFGFKAIAQQQAMYTHYSFNTQAINPAYAGTRDALTVTTLHRSQWVGFEGAPKTYTVNMHSPVFNNQLGVGLSLMNDKIGPLNTTSVYADFAYKLKVSEKGKLAFGIKGGFDMVQVNFNSIILNQQNDPAFAANYQSKMIPNVGAGAYYYTPTWYFGVSIPKIMENSLRFTGSSMLAKEKRHFFFIAGRVFDLGNNIKFKPTTFVKATNGAPIEADLTGMLIFSDKIEVGAMFRTGDAIGALFGINLSDQLRFGYSFDWSYGIPTGRYNYGSHELILRYDFIYKDRYKVRSPRYF
ncbi:MAG: type IX secretion system membrane protein PorP/SprF [Cytophagaceae bacterium]